MRVIVTAGPTREYIDSVRFITNASSGMMGCAVAEAASWAGHDVTLILAEGVASPPGCRVVRFRTVDDLAAALDARFARCDALVMAAAVGDFRPDRTFPGKLSRQAGPVSLTLVPVQDILAGLGGRKRLGQKVVAFAVQEGPGQRIEQAARDKMIAKGADFIVANTPDAMAAEESMACVLSADGLALDWAVRTKASLAAEIVKLL